jgi:hypothetical protein
LHNVRVNVPVEATFKPQRERPFSDAWHCFLSRIIDDYLPPAALGRRLEVVAAEMEKPLRATTSL